MATTIRDVLALAPEFATLEPDVIGQAITDATGMVDPTFWYDGGDYATRLFSAHLLSLSYPELAKATITEETIGPLHVAYSTGQSPGGSGEELASSRYGRRLLEMIQSNPNSHAAVL